MNQTAPIAWEYQTESVQSESRFNELGAAGWELVGVESGRFIFKRPAMSFRDRVTLDQKQHYYKFSGRESDGGN